jgi:hypothetical protein
MPTEPVQWNLNEILNLLLHFPIPKREIQRCTCPFGSLNPALIVGFYC